MCDLQFSETSFASLAFDDAHLLSAATATSCCGDSTTSDNSDSSSARSVSPCLDENLRDESNPVTRYQVRRVLCDSLFGKVVTALDMLHNRQVAIKLSNTDLVRAGCTVSGRRVVENPVEEAALLRRLPSHPNVIALQDEHQLGNVHWMVMEYAPKGEFFDLLSQTGTLSESVARRYMQQLTSAAAHLHQHGVCHLDISMENMLLDQAGNVKLTDFGVARRLPASSNALLPGFSGNKPGKLRYMAPEVLQGGDFCGRRADSFALGVVLFAMLTGTSPFEAAHPSDRRWQLISQGRTAELLQMIQLRHLVSDAGLDLLTKLFAPQQARFTAAEALLHPFLA